MPADANAYNIVAWLLFFLFPGLVIITSARKIVEHNARAYPRVYGKAGKAIALIGIYSGAIFWIVLGFKTFVLQR